MGIKQMVTFHEIDFLQVCNVGGGGRRRGWEKEEKEKEGEDGNLLVNKRNHARG